MHVLSGRGRRYGLVGWRSVVKSALIVAVTIAVGVGTASVAAASPVAPVGVAGHGSGGPGTVMAKTNSVSGATIKHAAASAAPMATGALSTVVSNVVHGGYTAAGIGMRNIGSGTISITGVPAGASVVSATLLWDVLADQSDPTLAQGTFDGTSITGTSWASGSSPCWPPVSNWSYEANVTSLVSGNGSYALSSFASGETDGADPFIAGSAPPLLEGASLVVVYQLASMPQTVVQIAEGATETDSGNSASATLDGFTVGAPVSAKTTYIVADGQEAGNTAAFNGTTLPDLSFPGADPQSAPAYSQGSLWDTVTTDVSPEVSPGATSATFSVTGNEDCLVWVGQVLSVSAAGGGQCGNTVYIAAIGSGENYKSQADLSVSPVLAAVYNAMKSTDGGKSIGKRVLDYPATSVDELYAGLKNVAGNPLTYPKRFAAKLGTNIQTYLNGKSEGVAALWDEYDNVRAGCPAATKIVLGGYSQGSMVVHEFLDQLAATSDAAGRKAIIGAVLVADPERVKHSNILELSDAPYSSYGVCDLVSLIVNCAAPSKLTDIAQPFQNKAISVCKVDDPVCDTSQLAAALAKVVTNAQKRAALINLALTIHTKDYQSLAATKTAGKLVGRIIARD